MHNPFLKHHIKQLALYLFLGLLLLTFSRSILTWWQYDRLSSFNQLWFIFVGGLRIDLSLLLQLAVIPLLGLILVQVFTTSGRFYGRFMRHYYPLALALMVFMELATPTFILEYDTRPDRLFIEYLVSPKEVLGMLVNGYLLPTLMVLTLSALTTWYFYRLFRTDYGLKSHISGSALVFLIILIPVFVLGIRSGLQHRPINPAMVTFSQDRMLNTLPLNSLYHVLYDVYQMRHEASAAKTYGSMPTADMLTIIQNEIDSNQLIRNQHIPSLHRAPSKQSKNNKNLIIVVEESLGAQFVAKLGGQPVTQYLDEWAEKSWWFERLYATGTRSARGLEAITTGFLPSPARAVLKLPKAQHDFFSIASLLANEGYETSFIYGGESHFDNMRGFFLGNGFQTVIDQNDYQSYEFMGNWGVSDEDLFNEAYDFLIQNTGKPKLTVIFTSSNHTPFEFPDQKINLYEQPKQTVNNAVRYADYAVNKFLIKLAQNGFFKNSVVMVVADHDARVQGAQLVPVSHFHIPGMIISDDIKPFKDRRLVSQIDLAPTLISLLGIESPNPMTGYDLTQKPLTMPGRAIMQYGNNQAYMTDDVITILRPESQHLSFTNINDNLGVQLDQADIEIPLAHALFSSWAYDQQAYRLP
ncbi:MAG: LTA synthase family protein [Proteobacteria bacterium]|nr:MAG: LTA synthase family protein [Pseudomonadota bacterium]